MAGYSGTPLPQKLGIKPGHRLLLRNAPKGFDATLSPLPPDVRILTDLRGREPFDVIVFFALSAKEFEVEFSASPNDSIPPAASGSPGPRSPRVSRPTSP